MAEFLDKMIVGINKGVNTVSENSKILVEKARLNTEIKNEETKKSQIIMQLGLMAYDLQASGAINVEQFNGLCGDVTQCINNVNKYKEDIQKLESSKAAAQPVQQPQYVAPVQQVPVQQAPVQQAPVGGKQCQCSFINKPDAKFCAKCGNKLA